MTIQLKPEQEQIVGQAIQAGLIANANDILDVGIDAIRQPASPPATPKSVTAGRRGVADTREREARHDDSAKAGARANRRAGDSGRSESPARRFALAPA